MKIGIDISQIAYEGTGVANYLTKLVQDMIELDQENEYILFFSSLRKKISNSKFKIPNKSQFQKSPRNGDPSDKITIRRFRIPPVLLDLLWNKLHIAPIEWFVGDVDLFITSDWTEPPVIRSKKATIFYDLIIYKYPQETDSKIIATQKRKLAWVKKESDLIFCISEATKKDAMQILRIEENKIHVIYPGV